MKRYNDINKFFRFCLYAILAYSVKRLFLISNFSRLHALTQIVEEDEIVDANNIYMKASNYQNFTWLNKKVRACSSEDTITRKLLFIIHTAPNHFSQRNFIRSTWGHESIQEKVIAISM